MNALRTLMVFMAAPFLIASQPAALQAATPDMQAAALLRESRKALGGSALDRVKILELTAKLSVGGLPGTGSSWQEIGGRRFAEWFSNPPLRGGDGYDGTNVWNLDGSGLVWIDGGQEGRAQEISQAFAGNYTLWSANHGGAAVAFSGTKSSGSRAYDVLSVTAPGSAVPFQLWFDKTTHLPMRFVQTSGPNSSTTTYADYRPVHGLMVAFTSRTESSDGNVTAATVTQAVVNPPGSRARLVQPASNVHDFSIAGGAASTSVPIDVVENHVYLSVMLNGKGPYRFIYDTGGANIVDPAVAQEVGAIGRGSLQGGGVGSTTESVSFANVNTLQVGDAILKDQLFGVAPTRLGFGMSGGRPVDGLIGFEVLARFVTTFDYAGNRVVLQRPGSAQPAAGADVLPLVLNSRQPQFACAIDGIASQCALDTGARDSITFFAPFIAAHPQIVPPALTAIGVNGFGFGGPALGKLGRLGSLRIGKFTLPNIVADFTTQQKGAFAAPFVAANVGGNIWKRFTLTLDYYKQTMALQPNGTFNDPDFYERAGLFLLNRGGKYVVLDARPGTPAAQAGIVKGDVIVSIDKTPASSMSLQAVRDLFLGAPGTVLHLGISGANGATREITLVLRDFV